jgi:hypothetical protein
MRATSGTFTQVRGHGWTAVLAILGLSLAAQAWAADATSAPASSPASAPAGTPKYRCDRPAYELSNVWAGDKVQHTFIIRNDGDAPLTISKVEVSCGCMVADDYSRSIAPGAEGKVPVTLSTALGAKQVHKELYVNCNDPRSPRNTLVLEGQLTARIETDPLLGANWGRYQADMPKTKTVKLTNNTPKPVKLELVKSDDQGAFGAELKETKPGQNWDLLVKLPDPLPEGTHLGRVHLKTSLSDQLELLIPASVTVPKRLDLVPAGFSTFNTAADEDRQILLLNWNGEGEMKVLSAKVDDPRVQTAIITLKPGKSYHLSVTIPPGYKPKVVPIQLKVTTDSKEFPYFEVPITPRTLPGEQPATATSPS